MMFVLTSFAGHTSMSITNTDTNERMEFEKKDVRVLAEIFAEELGSYEQEETR